MRPRCAVGAVVLLLLPTHLASQLPASVEEGAAAAQRIAVETVAAAVEQPARVLQGTIGRRTTLGAVLRDALSPAGVHRLVEASRPVYDLARVSVGHPFGVTFGPDGLARRLHLRDRRAADAARHRARARTTRPRSSRASTTSTVATVHGEITSSLFGAVSAAGEEDQLALDLADIFMWDVDFNTELQKGDSFRVAVEKLSLDGKLQPLRPHPVRRARAGRRA